MKSHTLPRTELFAFGGDNDGEEDERIKEIPPRSKNGQFAKNGNDEDSFDEEDDDDLIADPKDRRIRKLSREANRRRIENRDLRSSIKEREEEISDLRKELGKADRLQKNFDKLKGDLESQQSTVRKMAIRRAIDNDMLESGEKRSWYDVSMVESLLNPDELAVDLNDFSVGGLREQLDAIAGEKPFLVKGLEGQSDGKDTPPAQSSGSAPQSSATGTPDHQRSNEEAQMMSEFPALSNVL